MSIITEYINARFPILSFCRDENVKSKVKRKKVTLIGDYSQITWKPLIYSK